MELPGTEPDGEVAERHAPDVARAGAELEDVGGVVLLVQRGAEARVRGALDGDVHLLVGGQAVEGVEGATDEDEAGRQDQGRTSRACGVAVVGDRLVDDVGVRFGHRVRGDGVAVAPDQAVVSREVDQAARLRGLGYRVG